MPFLLMINNGTPVVRFPLGSTSAIGRSSQCEIQLPDLKASRRHALIYVDGGSYYLKDLESENGTCLNGTRIDSLVKLNEGDEIIVGDQTFIFDPPVELLHERAGDKSLLLVRDTETEAETWTPSGMKNTELSDSETFLSIHNCICEMVAELDPDPLLKALVNRMINYFSADRGYILSYNQATGAFRPLAITSEKTTIAMSRTLIDKAMKAKAPILVQNALEDISFSKGKSILKHRLRSVMIAPLVVKDTITGFIQLDKNETNGFSASDLNRFYLLCQVAGPALENSRKYEKERKNSIALSYNSSVEFIGQSNVIANLLTLVEKAAVSDARVILTGETGTGKELIARMIHEKSQRADQPWIPVNCAAIPEDLLESEFFGHEKGAFSGAVKQKKGCFELADGGTLFLDEVAEVSPAMQAKLLRALQEGRFFRVGGEKPISVDVRVVSATNRNLKKLIHEDLFREDLYYRLNVITIETPPMRSRPEDVGLLCNHFLHYYALQTGQKTPVLSPEALTALENYNWPGNVRELQNLMERLIVLNDQHEISEEDLPIEVRAPVSKAVSLPLGGNLHDALESVEKEILVSALKRADYKKVDAARILGISRPTLDKKIKNLKLNI